jgi:hypothetical protein
LLTQFGMEARTAIAAGVLTVGVALAFALIAANRRWASDTGQLRQRLQAANAVRDDRYSGDAVDHLPARVQRYLALVLKEGQPMIRQARVTSAGTFNMGQPPTSAWKPFTAVQDFYPGAPGFVWDARVRMMPGIDAYVRDAFADGQGVTFASVLGLVKVADSRGTPAIAAGALMRYLAEAPWFPTAFLPGQGVAWSALPDPWARATITTRDTTVSVDFEFGPDGLIPQCRALRDNDQLRGKYPWGGRYRDWVERDGVKIPGGAEVYWALPTGEFPYWRGKVDLRYDFTSPRSSLNFSMR